jgi:hypothetical protein
MFFSSFILLIYDQQILQNDLIKLENWSDKCLLKFHPEKCKHMNMHRTTKEEEVKYNLLGQEISKVKDQQINRPRIPQHSTSRWCKELKG